MAKTKTEKELNDGYTASMQTCYAIASELMARFDKEPPKVPKPPKVVNVSDAVVDKVKEILGAGPLDEKRTLDAAIVGVDGYKDANELKAIYLSLEAAGVIRYEKQKRAGQGATITLVS